MLKKQKGISLIVLILIINLVIVIGMVSFLKIMDNKMQQRVNGRKTSTNFSINDNVEEDNKEWKYMEDFKED